MNKVKKIRTDLGYTQSDFAKKIGYSKACISKIETGAIPISAKLSRKIATHFNLSDTWMSDEDNKTNEKSLKENMYDLIKHNFRNDSKNAYLVNNAFFDMIDTSNMSEAESKEYIDYISSAITDIASHFKETAKEIKKENK
jgi:DNA-binding XRE family transcriptional regulator